MKNWNFATFWKKSKDLRKKLNVLLIYRVFNIILYLKRFFLPNFILWHEKCFIATIWAKIDEKNKTKDLGKKPSDLLEIKVTKKSCYKFKFNITNGIIMLK